MEWFFIFVALGLAAYFRDRLNHAEHRIAMLEEWRDLAMDRMHAAPVAEPARPASPDTAKPEVETPPAVETEPVAPAPEPVSYASAPPEEVSVPTEEERFPEAAPEPAFSLARLDFEDIFGRRLPIWAGGITLAIAGVFMVRYSIDHGLLSPVVRVVLAFLFGLVLLAAAELAFRNEDRVADPRVRQALAGAGLATLYAAFYLAGTQYGLVGQTVAFLGLAAVTAASIALSFRFGLPSAVLGLVGGFAAPALVAGDNANLPLLALYLGLVTGGLIFTGERQKRAWLGVAALVGGIGWGALLLLGDGFDTGDVVALGFYFIVLGAVLPTVIEHERFSRMLRAAGALAASMQLALLVSKAGYQPLAWGLYLLLGATLAWFGWRRDEMRIASPVAALVGLFLYGLWPLPDGVLFTAVGAALAVIFAGVPLALVAKERDGPVEWGMLALVPPALAALAYGGFGHFEQDSVEWQLALATLALGAFPAAGMWLLRERGPTLVFAGLAGVASAMLFAALLMLTPGWSAPLVAAAALIVPAWLAYRREDSALRGLLWLGSAVAFIALLVTPQFFDELERLVIEADSALWLRATLRWVAAMLPLLALAMLELRQRARGLAEFLAALMAYGALAQFLPADALAWTAALAAIALYRLLPARSGAILALGLVALGLALYPLGEWAEAALLSLTGDPILLQDLPSVRALLLRIIPAALALGLVRYPVQTGGGRPVPLHWAGYLLMLVAVHVLFRQLLGIGTMTEFAALGMAERTLWQAGLLAAAWIAAQGVPRLGASKPLAIALAGASLAHFALYSLWWHNPMTADQAVGPVPLANLFFAAYGVAIAACLLLRRWLPEIVRPAVDGVIMFLATLGALALLRQAFGGSTPFDVPLGQTEDLLRSLVGIVMALLFLWLGSRLHQRSWRIGSLVVMLVAVLKVFLLDAAGLEGLLRIASFAALGASLIGLGWFYTRQLKSSPGTPPAPQ